MKGFFLFVVFTTGFVLLLRYLRKREVESFMESDMADFQTFRQTHEVLKKPDPITAQAEAYAAINPGIIELKKYSPGADAGVKPDRLNFVDAPVPILHRLKSYLFDEVTRNMLILLGKVAPRGVLVLLNVPLSEFVKTHTGETSNLAALKVTYLLCDATRLEVICGVQHRDAGATGRQPIDQVKSVFGDIGLPLLEFPVSNDISEHEVRDKLDPVLLGSEVQVCPGCAGSMTIRKAIKAKSAGRIFWVCNDFPTCRGVIKA
ncbi:MAG TPA: hypothetical protein DCS89_15790 [Gammaproteobacteria bacterium]|jgi:hypothetical protein|nr:hypothetical protein [Gammaproteobacteria bacterium]